jgi:glycosyltransferase involved in cell wall biosynthesis
MASRGSQQAPTLTVVIAAYNCARWIDLTVQDVLSQSYTDFELIVVDDGSTDSTVDIIKAIKDSRVRYVYQPNSGAPAKPRNTGLAAAQGKFITFLDHDDRWDRERLKKVMECFERSPESDAVVHDEKVVSDGKIVTINKYGPASDTFYVDMLLNGNSLSPSATTLKTEVVRKYGGFDERREYITVEDFDLWLRMAKAGCRFVFLHEVLGEYTLNGSNLTANVEAHHARRSNLIKAHLEAEAKLLGRFEDRILGYWHYAFARDLHSQRKFGKAVSQYLLALKRGYFTPRLMAGLGLSLLRIRA